ncbi:MAG: gamma-glutamyl-gamma-aminobutyrate hydrolase family protein [bacterium]
MSRPVIGICAALEQARWAAWDIEASLLPRTYSRAVTEAGAQAVVLPPHDEIAEAPDEALELIEALLLAGGSDIDPASYGAPPSDATVGARRERDRFEISLCRRAVEREMPLLGICRGLEILNVAYGGDLVQDLETAAVHMHTPGVFSDHEVELVPGSTAARAVGAERVAVRSHHHQGVGRLGEGLVVSGRSVGDGVIEAIEMPGHEFALGILWHAEEDVPSRVISSLVAATRVRSAAG